MTEGNKVLIVDILAEAGPETGGFKVMGCQGVSGHQAMAIAGFNKPLHCLSAVFVKCNSRAENPDNMAVFPVVPEDIIEFVIGAGEWCFTGSSGTEGKLVGLSFQLYEAVWVNKNTFLTVFCSADDNEISFF